MTSVIPITDINEVKFYTGPLVDDATLIRAAAMADKQLYAIVNREDIPTDSTIFGMLQSIGAAYAAWMIVSGWDQSMYGEKAKNLLTVYQTLLTEFHEIPLPDEEADPIMPIVASDYTIHALNDEVDPFLSWY